MGLPSGTKYYIPVTVDRTLIGEASASFPYQIDLSSKLAADSTLKSNIASAANVAIYDPVADAEKPRIVALDLSNNKLLIAFDGATIISANKTFYVCVGSTIAKTNSSTAFSNSNYSNRWGFNEFTAGATTSDSVGSATGTVGSAVTMASAGKFGNGALFTLSTNSKITMPSEVFGTGNITIEAIVNAASYGTSSQGYVVGNGKTNLYAYGTSTTFKLRSDGSAQATAGTGAFPLNQFVHVLVTRTSAGVTNFFINGALSGTANQSSGTPVAGSANMAIGNNAAGAVQFDGAIDEVGLTTDIKTAGFALTRYNQFFGGGFWTVGSGVRVGNKKQKIYIGVGV